MDDRATARRARDIEAAVERRDAVGESPQARAAGRVRAAHAVVAHLDGHAPVVARDLDPGVVAWAYLATFVSASDTTK